MGVKIGLAACAVGMTLATGWSPSAHAQSATIVPSRPTPLIVAEQSAPPNGTLLATGISTLIFSYGPAVAAGVVSEHKGDDNLFIPIAGPWLDLANRGCDGPTVLTEAGTFDVTSGQTCGTSGIEEALLVTSGIVQALGAFQLVAAFLVPEKRRTAIFASSPASRVSVAPTSFAGRGAGLVAAGRF